MGSHATAGAILSLTVVNGSDPYFFTDRYRFTFPSGIVVGADVSAQADIEDSHGSCMMAPTVRTRSTHTACVASLEEGVGITIASPDGATRRIAFSKCRFAQDNIREYCLSVEQRDD